MAPEPWTLAQIALLGQQLSSEQWNFAWSGVILLTALVSCFLLGMRSTRKSTTLAPALIGLGEVFLEVYVTGGTEDFSGIALFAMPVICCIAWGLGRFILGLIHRS